MSDSLFAGAQQSTTLRTLDLRYTSLGEGGGVAVARALERNTTLTTLDLRGNDLGEAGGRAFAVALERNTTLVKLRIVACSEQRKKIDTLLDGRVEPPKISMISVKAALPF